MIIPPSSLEILKRSKIHRRLKLQKIVPPAWPNWNPLIVVGKLEYFFLNSKDFTKFLITQL